MTGPHSVLLTRHGESGHNLNTKFYMGRSPGSRLTDRGRDQARRLGDHLAATTHLGGIVASSLPRTVETAEIVAQRVGIPSVHTDDAFWELSKGEWEGRMPRNEVPSAIAQQMADNPFGFQFPGGESFAMVERRIVPAFRRWTLEQPDETILFVLHGDVICALLHHLLGFPGAAIHDYLVRPCSLTELTKGDDGCRLSGFNLDVAQ